MRTIFFCILTLTLTACNTSKHSIGIDYSATPPEKGLIAFRLGQKSMDSAYPPSNVAMFFGYSQEIKDEESGKTSHAFNRVAIKPFRDNNTRDYLIEADIGKYYAYPASVAGRNVVKAEPTPFNVKSGQITYIGQYDIATLYDNSGTFGKKLKKTLSLVGAGASGTIPEILEQYPHLSGLHISNQAPHVQKSYRTRPLPTGPVYVHFYPYQ